MIESVGRVEVGTSRDLDMGRERGGRRPPAAMRAQCWTEAYRRSGGTLHWDVRTAVLWQEYLTKLTELLAAGRRGDADPRPYPLHSTAFSTARATPWPGTRSLPH